MKILTDFGDLAVLLPISAVLMLWLLVMRTGKGVTGWLIAVALCVAATAALKIYFSSCPVGGLTSPSGHASFSVLIYFALAVIVVIEAGAMWQRSVAVVAAALLVLGIATSRVALTAHSVIEVAFGVAIGLTALAIFARAYARHRPSDASALPLFGAVVLVVTLFHGRELHAEELLRMVGIHLHVAGSCL